MDKCVYSSRHAILKNNWWHQVSARLEKEINAGHMATTTISSSYSPAFDTQSGGDTQSEAEQPVPDVANGDGHDANASIASPSAADGSRSGGDQMDNRSDLPALKRKNCSQSIFSIFELSDANESWPPAERTSKPSSSRLESSSTSFPSPLAQPGR